jgi:hypothetical protein
MKVISDDSRNAVLTCGNAYVPNVSDRLSARPRERAPPLAFEVAGGGIIRWRRMRADPLWTVGEGHPVSAERTPRVTMTDSVVLSCVVCGYPVRRPVSSGSELCGPCLYLAVFRERFGRGTPAINGRGRLRSRKDSA